MFADGLAPGAPGVYGEPLSEAEMTEVSGALRIFGINVFSSLRRVSRKQRTTEPALVHCDIIAQNRADDLGLNTSNQDGTSVDYNSVTVGEIYGSYPDNRYTQPPAGTAGYIFTSYSASGMEHMGTYSRGSGTDTYDRYWNDSFTEYSSTVGTNYTPTQATDQMFVPLPSYEHGELYYR